MVMITGQIHRTTDFETGFPGEAWLKGVTGAANKLIEMVVNRGVTLGNVASLIGYIMPAFLELTFPMAVLLGVLMGFGRMSGDRELIAARACGMSLYRLAMPVLGFAIVIWAFSSWLSFSVRPWANGHLRDEIYELTQTRSAVGLKDKVFNRNFPGLVIYVDHISATDEILHGVLISDARNPAQHRSEFAVQDPPRTGRHDSRHFRWVEAVGTSRK
jgi:lipopolysaccharide export system permease protein